MTGWAAPALARKARPRFNPTDLDLEQPGVAEVALESGILRGAPSDGLRLMLADFEIDLGLTERVEFDFDGAFSLDNFDRAERHLAGEPLWLAVKLGFYDGEGPGNVLAVGAQLGPRLPTLDAQGVGYGAVALVALTERRATLVLNAGFLLDPRTDQHRPLSLIGGGEGSLILDRAGRWTWSTELGFAHYLRIDPDELTLSSALSLAATPRIQLSLGTLVGILPAGDRAALLLGVAPKFEVW